MSTKGWARKGMDAAQLEQYLHRIEASEEVRNRALQKQADLGLLREICGLQCRSVPFENLNMVVELEVALNVRVGP